jgi:hypothetical protein
MLMSIDEKCNTSQPIPDMPVIPSEYQSFLEQQAHMVAVATDIFDYIVNTGRTENRRVKPDHFTFERDTVCVQYTERYCGSDDRLTAEKAAAEEAKKIAEKAEEAAAMQAARENCDRHEYARLHAKYEGVQPSSLPPGPELKGIVARPTHIVEHVIEHRTLEYIGQPIVPVESETGEP